MSAITYRPTGEPGRYVAINARGNACGYVSRESAINDCHGRGINPRFVAWCIATGLDPSSPVSERHDGHIFSLWIDRMLREATPADGVNGSGAITDQEAFTDFLWRRAEEEGRRSNET